MTKSRDNKQTIRAYMRTHDVNYTTAKRALHTLAALRRAGQIEQDADANILVAENRDFLNAQLAARASDIRLNPIGTHTGPLDPTAGVTLERHDSTGFTLTIRRAPVYLDPRTQPDEITKFLHVHDLNGLCIINRDRTLCTPDPDAPHPTTIAVIAAAKHNLTGDFPVVFMDPTLATNHDRHRAHHIHDLDGTCFKHRTRTFCTPPTPTHDQPPVEPDGTTIHQWHATAIDPTTGERVPTTITEVRYPADATGRRRIETTTQLHSPPDNNLPDPQFVPLFHASQRIELIRTPTNTPANHISKALILDETPNQDDTTNQIAHLTGLTPEQVRTAAAQSDGPLTSPQPEMTQTEWQAALLSTQQRTHCPRRPVGHVIAEADQDNPVCPAFTRDNDNPADEDSLINQNIPDDNLCTACHHTGHAHDEDGCHHCMDYCTFNTGVPQP